VGGPRRSEERCSSCGIAQRFAEGGEHPAGGRPRQPVAPPQGAEAEIETRPFGHGELHQGALGKILGNQVARHVAPADPLAQQHMLGAEVGKPPAARTDHREVAARGQR
jgi:hypothetical protein